MKDCSYYQELISRLIDRELSAEEGEELAAHARECADCRAVYAAFSSLSGMLDERLVEPPEELGENVMARLRRQQLRKKNTPFLSRRVAALAASAVLVLLGGSLVIPRLLRGASGEAAAPMAAPALYSASDAAEKAAAEEPAELYDAGGGEAEAEEALESTPIPVSNSFAAPAQDTTKSEQEMIAEATARAMEPETRAEVVDVSGQGRGARLARLLTGTQGELPAGKTPDRRFMLRFDVDGVSTQVLVSVYGEKVFFISLSGEQTDSVLADCSWSTLRGAIYN